MKILFLTYNATDSCSFYRAGGIAPDLRKKLKCEIVVGQWNRMEFHWQSMLDYDLIMMQRPFGKEALSMCQFLKHFPIPLWVDYDDYLLGIPVENRASSLYTPEAKESIRAILKLADIVTVPTKALKDEFLEFNKRIEVIPNAFNDYVLTKRPTLAKPKPLVMWRGTDSHIYDVMTQGGPINKVIAENLDWKFLFVGFYPWFLNESTNFYHLAEMDIIMYFHHCIGMNPSLMIVPLAYTTFNKCKSNIAYIEAAYFGAACIAPNLDEWIRPGCVNYEDAESFYAKVSEHIHNPENGNAKLAWEYVNDELPLSKINIQRVMLVNSLL